LSNGLLWWTLSMASRASVSARHMREGGKRLEDDLDQV
jgi:hypothetical protein